MGSEATTLAQRFLDDKTAKTRYRAKNPLSTKIGNYILHLELLNENVKCASFNQCLWHEADEEERKTQGLRQFILCLSCDRLYHLACSKIELSAIKMRDLPWICTECLTVPLNSVAMEVNAAQKNEMPFDQRINFFKKIDISSDVSDVETERQESPENPKVDSETDALIEQLLVRNKNLEKQNQDLIAVLRSKFPDLNLESNGKNSKEVTIKAQQKAPACSYSSAVLEMNAKSILNDESRLPVRKVPQIIHSTAINPSVSSNLHQSTAQMPQSQEATMSTLNDLTFKHLDTMSKLEIRKNLPPIEAFDGRPEKWLRFKTSVERNWREGEYSDGIMKFHIRKALTGAALSCVESLIDDHSAADIMAFLQDAFGNNNVIVDGARQKLANIKLSKPLTHLSCVEVTTAIAHYLVSCSNANIPAADATLSQRIHQQLEPYQQQAYYQFYFNKFPNSTTRQERLDTQMEFLNEIKRTLPIGSFRNDENKSGKSKGSYQLLTVSGDGDSTPVGNKFTSGSKDEYKYEIRDKETAKFLGYDMPKVNTLPKKCEICNKPNHFSVECRKYKSMSLDEKFKTIVAKGICLCCLLTTSHSARECDIKPQCGYKTDKNSRCSAKHHVTLHRNKPSGDNQYKKQQRRARTNKNAARAFEKLKEHEKTTSSSTGASQNALNQAAHQVVPRGYSISAPTVGTIQHSVQPSEIQESQVFTVGQASPRTQKLFRTRFFGENNRVAVGYALGDSGSEITLVKKSLIDDLGIKGEKCIVNLRWTNSEVRPTTAVKIQMNISGIGPNDKKIRVFECYAIADLNLAPRSLDVNELKKKFRYLRHIPFESYKDAIPAVLIGSRHASLIEACEPTVSDGPDKPVALRAPLGYTIYGGAAEEFPLKPSVNVHQTDMKNDSTSADEELTKLYAYANSIESLGIKPKESHLTRNEKIAMEFINKEKRILPDGTVELPLAWNLENGEIPKLPDNFPMAYQRQIAEENRLKKIPGLLEAYNNNFIALIKKGFIRPATKEDMKGDWPNKWYLPMSLVVNNKKVPIKTRNVYNASAKYKNVALNDKLLQGPNILVNILQPLMKVQENQIAVTADVEQMFLCIGICLRDQQCQRLLWRPSQDEPMQVYIQTRMLFGPAPSPFCSQTVKNDTADKYVEKYPDAAKALKEYTYMDDLLTSEPTEERAIEIAKQCIEILKTINWNLVGFQSNSLSVLQALNPKNVKQESLELLKSDDSAYVTKVLGVSWNPKKDVFTFQVESNAFVKLVTECGHRPTKRDQCSTIARIYDIVGFISHVLIRGKILLQRSWREKLDWDEEISEEAHKEWLKWLKDLMKVSLLEIPRLRFPNANMSDAEKIELHVFCDAGKEAIATVAYFVATIKGVRMISFVMSKAKVAPLKLKTKREISEMPRLETLAALIGARLRVTIQELHKDYVFEIHMWSDSEIFLNWVKNDNLKLPKFAISPVEEILEATDAKEWHYVDSKNNVADIATKFQKFNFGDINSEWFQGPEFLKNTAENWPEQKIKKLSEEFSICYMSQEAFLIDKKVELPPIDCEIVPADIIDRFSASIKSRWLKLVKATGIVLKMYWDVFVPALKAKNNRQEVLNRIKLLGNIGKLTASEIERAELFIIRHMQREAFPDEYEKLSKNKRINNRELLQLNVGMDENGVIRINSRVQTVDPAQRFAVLVPKGSTFSTALLFHYHFMFKHVTIEYQIAEFRSKYWMSKLRSQLKKVAGYCNYCNFRKAHPVEYKMSPLPAIRTDQNLKEFEVCGLDCAGPYTVKARNGHVKKVWILIFACTKSRFIHLHLLDSLSTLAVLEAIVIMYAAHGPVKQFISDNGTNFVGAANVIQEDRRNMTQFLKITQKELESRLAETSYTSWTFIPVQSPWFGAFYERLIQTVKKSLASTVENRKISKIEFNIALQEAAHRINCRPLTHNSIDSEDAEVLTPHHIAKHKSGWPLLPSVHGMKNAHDPLKDKDEYRKGRLIADQITQKFMQNYLPVLTKRTRWFKDFQPIKVGDLVLLIDPTKTRQAWERARVQRLYAARDNNARVADVLLPDGTIRKNRSVKRLAKLELSSL